MKKPANERAFLCKNMECGGNWKATPLLRMKSRSRGKRCRPLVATALQNLRLPPLDEIIDHEFGKLLCGAGKGIAFGGGEVGFEEEGGFSVGF